MHSRTQACAVQRLLRNMSPTKKSIFSSNLESASLHDALSRAFSEITSFKADSQGKQARKQSRLAASIGSI